jgi:hypothetical protein
MRQDIDGRIAEKLDIVGAAGQGSLDVAGREHIEKVQHTLPVQIVDHFLLRRCRLLAVGFIVNRIARRSIGNNFPA